MATGQTIILKGSFTSAGTTKFLSFPSGLDSLWVYNKTAQYAAASGLGVQYYWDTTMTAGQGTKYVKEATVGALVVSELAANTGFTLYDQSASPITATKVVNSISNAAAPLVTTAAGGTVGLRNGDIVRLYNITGGLQISGMDFTVGGTPTDGGTTFTLAYMQAIVAATSGTYSKLKWDSKFYPRRRFITNITSSGATTIVSMSVTHSFTIGQQVRLIVPRASSASLGFGMYQINGLTGNIIAVTQSATVNTITLDIDSSGFSPFVFPLTADFPITFAEVIPVGEATNVSLALAGNQTPLDYNGNPIPYTQSGILADATVDTSTRGIMLAAGTLSPAGATSDVITWSAEVAYSVNPLS